MDEKRWVRIQAIVHNPEITDQWESLGFFEGAYDETVARVRSLIEDKLNERGVAFERIEDTAGDYDYISWRYNTKAAFCHVDDPTERFGYTDAKFNMVGARNITALVNAFEGKGGTEKVMQILQALSEQRKAMKEDCENRVAEYIAQENKPSMMEILR